MAEDGEVVAVATTETRAVMARAEMTETNR